MNKLIISALLIFGLIGMSGTASAAVFYGTLTDGTNPIIGAQLKFYEWDGANWDLITVVDNSAFSQPAYLTTHIWDSNNPTYVTTNDTGEYAYAFDKNPYLLTNNYKVEISYGGNTFTEERFLTTGSDWEYVADSVAGWDLIAYDFSMNIPEFPTIALPVAAILGLMFIISSRKKEE